MELPVEIGNLSNLITLVIVDKKLKILYIEISNLQNLKKLNIEPKVEIDSPGWMSNLPNLI